MKKVSLFFAIAMLVISYTGINAQQVTRNGILLDQVNTRKSNGLVVSSVDVNLNDLHLSQQEMIVLTPVIRSTDNLFTYKFEPVVITGSVRDKVLKRAMDWEGYTFEKTPSQILRRHNNQNQSIPLTLQAPYEDWMMDAGLYMEEDMLGCNCDSLGHGLYALRTPLLFEPTYTYAYVTPVVEEVKSRSETHTARINFEVNRYKILRDFKDNARVLNEVDQIIREIRDDSNLTVTTFSVTGYASPEGNENSNMKLSEKRAHAFVNYIRDTYNMPESSMQVSWKGEDWEGLRKVVNDLNLSNKNEILAVLDEPNNLTRKNRLKALNGGETYRMLLRDHYPALRRNEYTIAYVARGFDVSEAREIIKTKPQHLSLNEMFLVARSYPAGSKENRDVFDLAMRYYPNNPVARLNAATTQLESGNIDQAIAQLLQLNTPESWNNLGIAYALKQDYSRANDYFQRAVSAGNTEARNNAQQLSRLTMGE